VFSQEHPEGPVTDHGEVLHLRQVPWASEQMWAPDAACRDGRYYLYFPARDREGVFRIGVAAADRPYGPFTPEPAPIPGSFSIDPCAFRDDDGEHYLAFGGIWGGQLQCWSDGQFAARAVTPADERPAVPPRIARLAMDMKTFAEPPRPLLILDEQGEPLRSRDTARRYFEGPWLHRYRGRYYFSYSTGDTHHLAYAVGDSPYGPFTYRGHFLTPPVGWTTHHSIVEFGGRWWLYYHDASLSGGVNHMRCVKVQELRYDAAGDIVPMDP
jgi:beta-xylosidase